MDACIHEAVTSFRKSLQCRAEFPESLINLGYSLYRQWFEVRHALERGLLNESYAQGWMNLGNTFSALEMPEKAAACFRRSIEVDKTYWDAYLNLGNVLKEEGEVKDAIATYRKAVEVKPDFAEAYLNLATALKEEGEAEAAADAFAEHYRLKPIAQVFLCFCCRFPVSEY